MRQSRRRFIATSSASAAFFAVHDIARPWTGDAVRRPHREVNVSGLQPRIRSLTLRSAAPVAAMRDFYGKGLGLPIVDEQPTRLTVITGRSRITFTSADPDEGRPFYHFAFNIPENKIRAARDWQAVRSPLMPIPERMRAAGYPDEVVDFSHWNAHSVYFFDPAGNVVEYIARHDLANPVPGGFSSADILCVSEIGLIVDDVVAVADSLKRVVGVSHYRGASDQFTALGDEMGLLLVMKRGRILNFDPSTDEKAARVYPTVATVGAAGAATHSIPGFPYLLTLEK